MNGIYRSNVDHDRRRQCESQMEGPSVMIVVMIIIFFWKNIINPTLQDYHQLVTLFYISPLIVEYKHANIHSCAHTMNFITLTTRSVFAALILYHHNPFNIIHHCYKTPSHHQSFPFNSYLYNSNRLPQSQNHTKAQPYHNNNNIPKCLVMKQVNTF